MFRDVDMIISKGFLDVQSVAGVLEISGNAKVNIYCQHVESDFLQVW